MPSSRRDRKVDLTRVGKSASKKREHIEKIRRYVDSYNRAYVITFNNPRNQKISELRHDLKDGQIIFGKNKVTILALRKRLGKALRPHLDALSKFIKGQCALLLTNLSVRELREKFDALRSSEFARPGVPAPQTVTLAAGPCHKFTHTLEPYLRQLGLPVKLVRGVVILEEDYIACKRDQELTPEQCRVLKLFELQLSEFRVAIIASWSEEEGVLEVSDSDSRQMITSLAPAVRVTCQKLDDGQYYFIPEAVPDEPEDTLMADGGQ
ncbi:mRNA turnover 4 [Clonorchis sinensis]|uniref:Ribosome assembly factor mrt4 n=1 Tax=Clonorchis sinensis TaxID=79923 RepID=A0A8T1M6I4_CLOSI|nr:mRNA turnover 4 [Clonorchis sinensis]